MPAARPYRSSAAGAPPRPSPTTREVTDPYRAGWGCTPLSVQWQARHSATYGPIAGSPAWGCSAERCSEGSRSPPATATSQDGAHQVRPQQSCLNRRQPASERQRRCRSPMPDTDTVSCGGHRATSRTQPQSEPWRHKPV